MVTGHLFQLGALLQAGVDVEGHDGQYSSVHRHGDGHLVQGYAVEQHLHVLQRADGHTCLADIAYHAFIVGVVATMCGQVEGHGKALLAAGQGCGGRKRWIPRRWRIRHIGGWSTGASRTSWSTGHASKGHTGRIVQMLHPFQVFLGITGFTSMCSGVFQSAWMPLAFCHSAPLAGLKSAYISISLKFFLMITSII